MYEYIKGKVAIKRIDHVAIDVNGVAYRLFISLNTYDKIREEEEKLYVFTHVREDSFKLFGFYNEEERSFFEILLNSSGVGPKLAMAVLSTYNTVELKEIILGEQIKRLTKVPGLGIKKGQKLILDIKDKIKKNLKVEEVRSHSAESPALSIEADLILALQSLGYSEKDIDKVLQAEDINNYNNIEAAIRGVLSKLHK